MDRLRKGYFEDADGGTLFLDEIGEMPLDLQAKLLRVVEEGCVYRIGSTVPIPVDVRLLSASSRDLKAEVAKGTFREDLYYRLAKLRIDLPPLRERGADLTLLGRHFRIRAAQESNRPVPRLDPSSVELLRDYFWPGNVRELREVLTRAILRCRGDVILPEHLDLPAKTSGNDDFAAAVRDAWSSGDPHLHQQLHDGLDRELIRFALEQHGGNHTQVADRLGLSRDTARLPAESEETSGHGDDFAAAVRDAWASGDPNLYDRLHDGLDRELIRYAMEKCGGNKTQVADRLGLSRNTVRKLVQKHCPELDQESGPEEHDK